MKDNTTGTSCLGPLAGLQTQQNLYQQTIEALSDPAATTLVLVTRAETSALREAARTSFELTAIGIENQHLVINGLFTASDPDDPYAAALEKRAKKALESVPEVLASRRQSKVPWQVNGTMGIDALRRLSESDMVSLVPTVPTTDACDSTIDLPSLGELIDEIADAGHGVVLAMGKGGVGKTTVAAAVALALAQRGHDVHLSTTDPAAHVAATVGDSSLPNLTVSRIDPSAETRKYSAQVMNNAGANLDEAGKALLAEDLRSPCTEEIAVFRAFADAVAQGADRIVVLDTAPTGHTVLLLDAALAYHREVTRQGSEMPAAVQQLLPRLRDPGFTRILIVTLPEATPVHEAAMLQRDLRRADIEPFAWVMNQVFTPLPVVDPILQQRKQCELKFIRDVRATHARRVVSIPWQIDSPRGKAGLEQLFLTNRPVAK